MVLKKEKDSALSFLRELVDSKQISLLQAFNILGASQQEVGSLWERGTITVADEHFTTEVTLEAIDLVSKRSTAKEFRREEKRKGTALLANLVEGEYHTVGLRMFAELLKADGWDVELFPQPAHVSNVFRHIEKAGGKIKLVCCTVTMEFNLRELKSILKILRTNIHTKDSTVIVGSQLFRLKRFRDQMVDTETAKPLADFLAKNLSEGIEFVRSSREENRSGS